MWLIGSSRGAAGPLILHRDSAGLTQLTLNDPAGALTSDGQITAIAAEPGTDSAWVGYIDPFDTNGLPVPARLARVHADGSVDDVLTLPVAGDGIARKGRRVPWRARKALAAIKHGQVISGEPQLVRIEKN